MRSRKISREELFALVWEKPSREVAKELGVSDTAITKLCERLQVPKPSRGYWARIQAGQTPKRPALLAFKEELDRKRRAKARKKAAGTLSKLQLEFYQVALEQLAEKGREAFGAEPRGSRLPELDPEIAAQLLLLIQNCRHEWIKTGKVRTDWSKSDQNSVARLVEKLLPLAKPQLLVFECKPAPHHYAAQGPVVMVRLTASLQERLAGFAHYVRESGLSHLVMPIASTEHAWSVRFIDSLNALPILTSHLCISVNEIWVEVTRRHWCDNYPAERVMTHKLDLRSIIPIDCLPVREIHHTPTVARASLEPYRERLEAFLKVVGVFEMAVNAAAVIEREVPSDTLAVADRLWFGRERSLLKTRDAWKSLEAELERWEQEIEAERVAITKRVLGIDLGDIMVFEKDSKMVRISVTGATLYVGVKGVTFNVCGNRFRKDGTIGKRQDMLALHFEHDQAACI